MLDNKYVQKKNTQASARAILEFLKDKQVYDVFTEISYISNNEYFNLLISGFEKQLLSSMVDKEKFQGNLYKFFKDNERFIKKNKIQKELLDFIFYIKSKLETQNTNIDICAAYMSLLMEQAAYIKPLNKMICGIKTDGTLIERPEVFNKFEYPSIELEIGMKNKTLKDNSFSTFHKLLKKHGYGYINSIEEFLVESCNQTIVSNMFFDIAPLIDEYNEDIIPLPFFRPAEGFKYNAIMYETKSTELYKEWLSERTSMLPSEGVMARLKNWGNLKEVLFKEVFKFDKLYMLYKAKMDDDTYTSGFYDITNKRFYSAWKDTVQEEGQMYHRIMENAILGLYASLTTDNEIEKFDVVDDLNDPNSIMSVQFAYNTINKNNDSKVQFRKFDKNNLDKETKQINAFIRRLPEGAKASQEAIDNAKKYGFKLKDGETFVKSFEKNVNIIKK